MKPFQAIVIGSGQAGDPLAYALADRGWTVALIEREHMGGSCINYGCTPTKTMLASAQAAHDARRAAALGVSAGPVAVDLSKVVARRDEIVRSWRQGHERQAAQRPTITVYRGAARFTGPHRVAVNEDVLTGDRIFINAGTSPRIPPIDGVRDVPYLTNKTILDLTVIPEHLIVLGGIGLGVTGAAVCGLAVPYLLRLLSRDPQVAAGPIALVCAELTRETELPTSIAGRWLALNRSVRKSKKSCVFTRPSPLKSGGQGLRQTATGPVSTTLSMCHPRGLRYLAAIQIPSGLIMAIVPGLL